MPNFDSPYFSTSIGEFWRRWHISLSTFFRDYVYVPLGGSRASRVRLYGNVMVTFVLSGVWHGAQWTFVVWGLLHGLFMLAGHLTAPARRRLGGALGRGPVVGGFLRLVAAFATFSLVTVAWVFFRASTVDDAFSVLFRAFSGTRGLLGPAGKILGRPASELYLASALIAFLCVGEALSRRVSIERLLQRLPSPARLLAYAATVLAILDLGVAGDIPFIYFQF